jgi:uncharacterized integral membrane protein
MTSLVFSLLSVLLVSVGALTVVIFNATPTTGFSVVNFGFYLFIFFSLYTLLTLSWIYFKKAKGTGRVGLLNRETLIISFFITGLIVMSSMQVLNIISLISFALSVLLLELFFLSQRRSHD